MIKTSYDFIRAYEKFIKRLNNTIPKIGYGGCGEFAMMIKDKLSNIEGVKVNGIRCMSCPFEDNDASLIDISNSDNIAIHIKRDESWSHFLIEIEYNNVVLWVDSDEACVPEDYSSKNLVYLGMFCEEELAHMIDQPIWNNLFKRSNIPLMKNFIQEYEFS